jgi:hypothetical protein
MSRPNYTARDQYSNLSRQDNRDPQDEHMNEDSASDSNYEQTIYDIFQDGLEEFKSLPKFLKSIFQTISKKHASLKCRKLNNQKEIALLEEASTGLEQADTLPKSIRFQIRAFEKRYSDVETIAALTKKLIDSEKHRLEQQNMETTLMIVKGPTELNEILKPIMDNSDTFKHLLANSELIFNSLVEQEFCTMLLKMEHDKKVKEQKRNKFEAQKELNNAPVILTTKNFKQMSGQINSLKRELAKLTTKPKNVKGKPAPKKSGKPTQTKGGKKEKSKKRNGNSKGTSKVHQ